jgi:hypothetical protein
MTQSQKALKTGMPTEQMEDGKDYGEGICPECGTKGEPMGENFDSLVGEDPFDELHQQAIAEVSPKLEELRDGYNAGDVTQEEFTEKLAEISDEAQAVVTEGVEANANNE